MKGILITVRVALFFLCLQTVIAYPAQGRQQEYEDELDSDEIQLQQINKVLAKHFGIRRNASEQEIVNKASTFLASYLIGPPPRSGGVVHSKASQDHSRPPATLPLVPISPTNKNKTIFITIVNSKNQSAEGGGIANLELGIEKLGLSRGPVEITLEKKVFESIIDNSTSADSDKKEQGLDQIEDAIFEALTFAQAEETKKKPPSAPPTKKPNVAISVPSRVVQQQPQLQQQQITISANGATVHLPVGQYSAQKPIIFVNQILPTASPTTTTTPTPTLFGALSKVFGSVIRGNLTGAFVDSFGIAHVPEVQNTVNGAIHTVASGVTSSLTGGLASGITSAIASGVTSELADLVDLGNRSRCQVLGNCPVL